MPQPLPVFPLPVAPPASFQSVLGFDAKNTRHMRVFDQLSGGWMFAAVDKHLIPIDGDWICVKRGKRRTSLRFDSREPLPDDCEYVGVMTSLTIPLK